MSIYSKYRKAAYIDCDKETHFSKKKYRPYHIRMQKKANRFDMDYYWVDLDDNSEGSALKSIGVNKKMSDMDFKGWHDGHKDGN